MVCGNRDDWGICKDLNDVGVEKECPKAKHKSCYMIVHCKLNKKDYLFYISVTCDLFAKKVCHFPWMKYFWCFLVDDKETNQPKSKSRGCTDLEYNGSLCLAKGEVTEKRNTQVINLLFS